ncbi:aspartate carbamoyltransferase [Gammaproteobacteria bacterium]|nr:aspartate carbamoyltransferase [Gammaproteobacteria bacterium]
MKLKGQHLLSSAQFDIDTLNYLYNLIDILVPVARGQLQTDILHGAVMGSLFFEASTRTRLSFDAAFMRLGGSVSNTTGVSFSSIVKGESLEDTARVIGGYFDVLVVRHQEEQAIYDIATATNCPLINGGNGAGEHPTQALLDMYTLNAEFKRMDKQINGSTIAMVGDLRHGRTVHSLMRLLSLYKNITFNLVAPNFLSMPDKFIQLAGDLGHTIIQTENLQEGIKAADMIYATRVQKERFAEAGDYVYSDAFRINAAMINTYCKKDMVIMHPLPRDAREGANDLSSDLNADTRLAIFRQSDAGVPTRMALFATILGVDKDIAKSLRQSSWFTPKYSGPQDAPWYKMRS